MVSDVAVSRLNIPFSFCSAKEICEKIFCCVLGSKNKAVHCSTGVYVYIYDFHIFTGVQDCSAILSSVKEIFNPTLFLIL